MKIMNPTKINPSKINPSAIFFLGLLGLLLLYSYYYYAKQNESNLTKLWARIKAPYQPYYIGSMFLSAFGFLFVLGYLAQTSALKSDQATHLLRALFSIVFLSLFWMPASLSYLQQGRPAWLKYSIIGLLLAIAFASLYATTIINTIAETTLSKQVAVFSMAYFFCHTFFLDTLTWSANFF